MSQRNELYALAKALATPTTLYEIIMALNSPDHLSPYKKLMTDMILAEVTLEVFINELYIIYEIDKVHEEERRTAVLQALKDEKAAEYLILRQDFEYATKQPRRLLERGDNIMELEFKAKLLQDFLNVERPKLEGYEKKIAKNKQKLTQIDTAWGIRQKDNATNYIAEFDKLDNEGNKKYKFELSEETKASLEKVFITPPPSKLLQINRHLIREAGDDEKKIGQYANTIALKGAFGVILKAAELFGSTRIDTKVEKKEKHKDVSEEHNLSVRALLARLRENPPIMQNVDTEKKMLAEAIKDDNESADLQDKANKIYSTEKALNKITDKMMVLKNQTIPEPPPRPAP